MCNGETVEAIIFGGSQVSNTTYQWQSDEASIGISASGNGKIPSFTAQNTTEEPITANISVVPEANSCQGETMEFQITVNPTPDFDTPEDIVVCNGETISSINFTGSNVSGTSFSWANDQASIGLDANGSGNIPDFTAKNNGNSPITANILVTPEANSCAGETRSFTITVNPTPKVEQLQDITICEGEDVGLIAFSNLPVENTTIQWTADNTETGIPSSGEGSIPAFSATNTTAEIMETTVSYYPVANSCEGETKTFKIRIKPQPVLEAPENRTFCSGTEVSAISVEKNIHALVFDISGGSEIGLSNRTNATEIPVFTPVNNSNTPKTASISLLPKYDGCMGEAVNFEITVNPLPSISVSPSVQEICSGETSSIKLNSNIENTNFSWEIESITPSGAITGAEPGSGPEIVQHLTNSTSEAATVIYRVVAEAASCETSPLEIPVTVNPLPVLVVNNPETVCAPAAVDLTAEPITAGSGNSLHFSYWKDEAATSELENPAEAPAGTYYIKAENASGCEQLAEVVVTEYDAPVLTSPSEVPGFCSETAFNYEFESSVPGTQFNWSRPAISGISTPANSDTGMIDEVLVNTTNHPIDVEYEVTMISPNGCIASEKIHTTVTPTPVLTSTLSPGSVCSGTAFAYQPESSVTGTTFTWRREAVNGISNSAASGNGAISETLENTTNQTLAVTYQFSLSSNNCSNPQTYSITVPVTPSPNTQVFAAVNDGERQAEEIEICEGGSIDLFSETQLPEVSELPSEILNANFNSGADGWSSTGNGTRSWNIASDNTTVDEQCGYVYVGPNWWDYEYQCNDVNLRSNDHSSFFLVNSRQNNGAFSNVALTSPVFSTSGYQSLNLSFWHYYRDGGSRWNDNLDIGRLEYRIGNGAWTSLNGTSYTSTQGSPNGFVQANYDISSLIGHENVQIRFNYDNANGDYYWAIDNISITGEGGQPAEVKWTADTSDWTSEETNPQNISPVETTTYTATYTDPETGCPGSASVKVIVRNPPQPQIRADYCAYPNEPNKIRLYVEGNYDQYEWTSSGEVIGNAASIDVTSAQGYSIRVWENGCEGTGSIDISENLIANGDFEAGNTGFVTQYSYQTNRNGQQELVPEGTYTVDTNSNQYHGSFHDNGDHTTGNGNFMIVNGDPNLGSTVWESNGYIAVKPGTDYYFSAWTTNLVYRNEAEKYAQLRLQIIVRNGGNEQIVAESTLGDLRFQNVGEWIEFYNPQVWNSGEFTEVKLRIINENTIRDGNDFGIDDISFAEINAVAFDFEPSNDSPVCEGGSVQLFANLEGGREPITYQWTGPNNFTSSEANPIIENMTPAEAGDYELQVTDFYGCDNTIKATKVTVIPATIVNAGEDQVICSDASEVQLGGSVSGSVSSGFWSGGNGSFVPSPNELNAIYQPSEEEIKNGLATLILTSDEPDAPCEAVRDTLRIQINPSPVIDRIVIQNVSCFGGDNGSASLIMTTGTEPFTYEWSNAATTQTINNLEAGSYSVVVTDANGCSAYKEFEIREPAPLELLNTTVTNIACFGNATGEITAELSGGFLEEETPQYIAVLLNSESEEVARIESAETLLSLTDIPAGNYTLQLSTAKSCTTISKSITLTQPEEIPVEAGEKINIEECGRTSVFLNATAVNAELGSGTWSIISGEGGEIDDLSNPSSRFSGLPETTYILRWTVNPENGCEAINDETEVSFSGACSQLDFDGEDDYVDLGQNFNFSGNFTVEAWVKPHDLDAAKTVISKKDRLNNTGYELLISNAKPEFQYNNKVISSPFKITTDRWYHLACTVAADKISLYIDGVEVKSVAGATISGNELPASIGASLSAEQRPADHFHGWIQEVRLWKQALSAEQLRFMMNQPLENKNGNVQGSILPVAVPGAPAWNSLAGYYRLLVNELNGGSTPDASSNNMDGTLLNMTTLQENTAPLPYILFQDVNTAWYDRSSWTLPATYNGLAITQRQVWDSPNGSSVKPSEKINWNIVILRGNIRNEAAANNQNQIRLLGLLSENGTFEMSGENNFSGNALIVDRYLRLDGVIDLDGESQLLQPDGSVLASESSGYLDKDQQGTQNSFNYNYWTSPVSEQGKQPNSGYRISEVLMDGSDPENPAGISFNPQYHWADHSYSDGLHISTYWLYVFHGSANQYSQWHHIDQNANLETAEGFTMKGTRGAASIRDLQNYTFRGMPNNGSISLKISKGENRLVGNPYPSAIDATEFIRDNLKDVSGGRNSANVFNGSLYFWDHFGQENTHILAEYVGGYATMNLSGGVPAIANDARINANGRKGSKIPARYIPVGQGFFVNASIDDVSGNNYNVQGGTVKFENHQRIFQRENPGNSQFLMQEERSKSPQQAVTSDLRPKIRLQFHSPEGYHRQLLVTGDLNATEGVDLGYDAPLIENNKEDLYWLVNDESMVIQAVPQFGGELELPLGMRVSSAKEFEISIDSLENWSPSKEIYLKDQKLDSLHDLRQASYKAISEEGEINKRFMLVFRNRLLEKPSEKEDLERFFDIGYYNDPDTFELENPQEIPVSKILIFDMGGKLLSSFRDIPTEKAVRFRMESLPAGTYIVKVYSEKGILNKKFLVKN
ncbi:MAG: PKD-like domain-containing protein [Christiangramia sp.]